MSRWTLPVCRTGSRRSILFLPHLSSVWAGLHTAIVLAVLLRGEVVRVAIAAVERVRLAGPSRRVVVPAGDGRSTRRTGLVGQRTGVCLGWATSVGRAVVVAVVVCRACGRRRRGAAADDEVPIRVGHRRALDALRFTSRISAVVLALLVGLEVVRIALTAGVYELLAVAGLGVEPPAIRVRSTVTLLTRKFAHVLRTWTANTTESGRAGRALTGVSRWTGVRPATSWRALHVSLTRRVLQRLAGRTENS